MLVRKWFRTVTLSSLGVLGACGNNGGDDSGTTVESSSDGTTAVAPTTTTDAATSAASSSGGPVTAASSSGGTTDAASSSGGTVTDASSSGVTTSDTTSSVGTTDDASSSGAPVDSTTGTSAPGTTDGPVDPTPGDETTAGVPGDPCDPATPLVYGPLPGPHTGRVTAVYLVPADQAVDETRAKFFRCALHVVNAWSQERAGRHFAWELSVVQSAHPTAWFSCSQQNTMEQCYPQIYAQVSELGYPLWSDLTLFALAVQGNLVHWGGTRIATPAGGGLAFVGSDLFTQLTDKGCLPGQCMTLDIIYNVMHDGDYITGGIAHELGHAFGLPHPDPATPNVAWSIMAEHWHYPNNGFLDGELAALATNPLLVP
jgi:hypothetical protein